jgi:hypothetical protein
LRPHLISPAGGAKEEQMDIPSRDEDLLRGFMLALHAMTLALEVGNCISQERYWRAVRQLAGTLEAFTWEKYQLGLAVLPVPPDAALPESLRAAWDEQFAYDREAARRILAALRLAANPQR